MEKSYIQVPEFIREKIYWFPEYSYGANRVTLIMKDGQRINDVFVAWGRYIVKIGQSTNITIDPNDIVDVENEP